MNELTEPEEESQAPKRSFPSHLGRYAWQQMEAIDRIARIDGQKPGYALLIYVVLTIESEKRKGRPRKFCMSIQKIADSASLGYRLTFDLLHALQDVGVIAITGTRIKNQPKFKCRNFYEIIEFQRRKILHKAQNQPDGILHKAQDGFCTGTMPSRADNRGLIVKSNKNSLPSKVDQSVPSFTADTPAEVSEEEENSNWGAEVKS
jgi:hypothetical protein